MSRNYEILRETEKGRNLFVPPSLASKPEQRQRASAARLTLRGIAREEIAKLVQRVFLRSGGEAPQLVVFSGVDGACGCSSICVQAAEALASQVGSPVCLIDGNLRTPSLHRLFGLAQDEGLTDAVFQAGPARRFAHRLNGGNLFMLTAGSPGAENHFFMNLERMQGPAHGTSGGICAHLDRRPSIECLCRRPGLRADSRRTGDGCRSQHHAA